MLVSSPALIEKIDKILILWIFVDEVEWKSYIVKISTIYRTYTPSINKYSLKYHCLPIFSNSVVGELGSAVWSYLRLFFLSADWSYPHLICKLSTDWSYPHLICELSTDWSYPHWWDYQLIGYILTWLGELISWLIVSLRVWWENQVIDCILTWLASWSDDWLYPYLIGEIISWLIVSSRDWCADQLIGCILTWLVS